MSSSENTNVALDGSSSNNNNGNNNDPDPDLSEIGHYVVTSHPPGSVFSSFRCSFLSSSSIDVVIAKSNRLEIRRYNRGGGENGAKNEGGAQRGRGDNVNNDNGDDDDDPFPLMLTLPVNGRVISIAPIRFPSADRDCLFFTTEKGSYALISYDESLASSSVASAGSSSPSLASAPAAAGEHYPVRTHASGSLRSYADHVAAGGRTCECGPLMAIDPLFRCVALHVYDGYLTILPINGGYDFRRACDNSRRKPWRRNAHGGGVAGAAHAAAGGGGGGGGGGGLAGGSGKPAAKPSGRGGRNSSNPFLDAFHLRVEERTVLSIAFLRTDTSSRGTTTGASGGGLSACYLPQIAMMHQDARGLQHVISHGIDISKKRLVQNGRAPRANDPRRKGRGSSSAGSGGGGAGKPPATTMPPVGEQLKMSRVEGGSGQMIPVPPPGSFRATAYAASASASAASATAPAADPATTSTTPGKPAPHQAARSSAESLGGVIVLGQRQVTYHCTAEGATRVRPTGGALLLSHCRVVDDEYDESSFRRRRSEGERDGGDVDEVVRYLVGDDRGRLHLLSLTRKNGLAAALRFDTLGTVVTSASLTYLGRGVVFVGSQWGNSQLVRILDEPVPVASGEGGPLGDTTYVEVLEEYENLGPIVDFDLRPCGDSSSSPSSPGGRAEREEGSYVGGRLRRQRRQSLAITCSGVGKEGTVRSVRNGVGMREHAAVEMEGIKGMWSLRRRFGDEDDAFLVQSFVRETRILGVQSAKDVVEMEEDEQEDEEEEEEEAGALAEVTIPGFDSSKSTLFAGNVLAADGTSLLLQVVEDGVRLVDSESLTLIDSWSPFSSADGDDSDSDDEPAGFITVASANESGQIAVALRGGALAYLSVEGGGGGSSGGDPDGSPSSSSKPFLRRVRRVALDREISCIDLNPLGGDPSRPSRGDGDAMDIDGADSPSRGRPRRSRLVAVGLWDDFSVRLLNLGPDDPSSPTVLDQALRIDLGRGNNGDEGGRLAATDDDDVEDQPGEGGRHMMARSLCLVTMDSRSSNANSIFDRKRTPSSSAARGDDVDMLFVGLGDGKLISFVVERPGPPPSGSADWSVHSRKEVGLGTQGVHLVPFRHGSNESSRSCVLATGDRPTVVYLAGGNAGGNGNPKLNYSTVSLTVEDDDDDDNECEGGPRHASHRNVSVNVASPFRSSLLFSSSAAASSSSLCVADERTLRLGVIDDIRKLHVTTYKLGMTPRRICHHEAGRVYCVGCIGGADAAGMEANQNNCVRFFDDSTFEELHRVNLEPFEMILSIESVSLSINAPPNQSKSNSNDNAASPLEYRPFIVMGTAYGYPDEDEPSQGRIIVVECNSGATGNLKSDAGDQTLRHVRQVADLPFMGGIYDIAPFYGGNILVTCNSKTVLCQLYASVVTPGELLLDHVGSGHHGHLISLRVKSLATSGSDDETHAGRRRKEKRQLAIVGDLMRSIALVEYCPKHQVVEEVARDFNSNFCTEIAMLTDNVYLGGESYNNLFVLRHDPNATTEQARSRLDTVGHYHLGEMTNKMMGGSLVMPGSNPSSAAGGAASANGKGALDKSSYESGRKIDVAIGSQTLYGTVDGTIGSILGLGGKTFAFLNSLQRAMDAIVRPVGDLSRGQYRAWKQEQKEHASCGFVDGDWIETFLDLNRPTMERVVREMNLDTRWRIRDDGKGFSASEDDARQHLMDTDEGRMGSVDARRSPHRSALMVEDVLGAVEEISMLH